MTSSIDAVGASDEIKATYRRYLQSLLAVREPAIDAALRAAIQSTPMLDKGPYLEVTPPYAPGMTIQELIDEHVLAPGFAGLASAALPLDRPLYVHQERAIRKVAEGRNIVVATGTGSGKTEAFLLPILDSLVREQERGELGPGVRALLLYPMNALANDQMKRLRQLLDSYPHITFGRYTGETENDPARAREMFQQLNVGEPLRSNELVSRQEMRTTPPHLLLTNYAMLEYLLLRPQDMDLFGTGGEPTWRFIVVDEAHVYDGSQGAEVAMLLRRVRDRVAPDRGMQCIATSATVGDDSNPQAVAQFASNLFGQPIEWVDDDVEQQDIVTAQRIPAPDGPTWGPLSAADYLSLAESDDPEILILTSAAAAGWDTTGRTAAEALLHEENFGRLRTLLSRGPAIFDKAAHGTFGPTDDAGRALSALVALGSSLRDTDGTTPLSARYHLFLRATEGAFTCLSDSGPHVQLARHEECPDCRAPVFEIGSCKRCGAVHALGSPTADGRVQRLMPRRAGSAGTWFLLGEQTEQTDEDEAAVVDDGVEVAGDNARLCANCAAVVASDAGTCGGCGSDALRSVRRLKQRGEEIAGCLVCGARGAGTVRVFETGPDASSAVIATALYQHVPPSQDTDDADLPGEGRKVLAFSDSRQAAAYFAPYLEDSYKRLQRRRLLAQGLLAAHADKEAAGVEDVVFTTRSAAVKVRHFAAGRTAQQQARAVAPWVMAEVVAIDDRQSLEGLGLITIGLERGPRWTAPQPLLDLGLSEDEVWALLQELVRSLRQQGSVTMPGDVAPNDAIFAPRLGPIRVRKSGSEAGKKVLSWLPTRGSNRRVDYLRRVLVEVGSGADAGQVLGKIWDNLTSPSRRINWLKATAEPRLGVLHQVDHELLRISWVTADQPVYRCTICRRIASASVRGVCPALGCEGTLEAFVPDSAIAERDHYRSLYQSMLAVPLRVKEHTAQWTSAEAATIQQDFVGGQLNVLSCTTTFELGVDVGELQAVLLRNVPPSTASYLQRAGRAGRRSGAAALVVTYAMRRSHDLTRFAEPEVMITGAIRAPYVPLTNERIDRRHAHSVAMAAFFRWLLESSGRIDRTAGEFFLPSDGASPSVDLVAGFLNPVPEGIRDSLGRILPTEVAVEIDKGEGGWVATLVELLATVQAEITADVGTLDELREQAAAARKYWLAERFQRVANTVRKRNLLGFLANRNVLPKYGFPVDSVELRTGFGDGDKLDLSRDLSQAIYEYAPDSGVVAGGKLWTSRGIYRLPGRDLVEYRYRVCRRCGGFRYGVTDVDQTCQHCGEVAERVHRTLTMPEFGFVAELEPQPTGTRPPRRSWSGAVHVLEPPPEVSEREILLRGGSVAIMVGARGRLIAVADGPGGSGYWICDWCGHGAARSKHPKKPPKHDHLLKNTPCAGPQRPLDLAHVYETDLLTLDIRVPGFRGTQEAWKSVLYAILEAACDKLEIARDELGGSLTPVGIDQWSIALFDRVSGGAGHVIQVDANFESVVDAALRRVTACECGAETSCYGCLRSYSNQRDHDELSRGAAQQILRRLIDGIGRIDSTFSQPTPDEPGEVPPDWAAMFLSASPLERALLAELAAAGVERPELGVESSGGIPIPVSWPAKRRAADLGLLTQDKYDLEAGGWTVVSERDLIAGGTSQ